MMSSAALTTTKESDACHAADILVMSEMVRANENSRSTKTSLGGQQGNHYQHITQQ